MTNKLIYPPPPNVPFGRVGAGGQVYIGNDWAIYLTIGLLNRIGGYNGSTPTDIEEMIADLQAQTDSIENEFSVAPAYTTTVVQEADQSAEIASLRAEVDQLRSIVEGLTRGTVA